MILKLYDLFLSSIGEERKSNSALIIYYQFKIS